MGMSAPSRIWTADEVYDLPDDGNRYEVVDGVLLVSPAPRLRHQRVVRRLLVTLDAYLSAHPVGEVFTAPLEARVSRLTALQPDLVVQPMAAIADGAWPPLAQALLVIEVLSPSTARNDRVVKRPVVQKAGVPLLWIVDADKASVECWTPEGEAPVIERERLTWHPPGASAPFSVTLAELLAPGAER
jgi:Uma2 family endonuclease